MHSHFEGKTAKEHLQEARKKGSIASAELHGVELPGHLFAAADAAKETAFILLNLSILALFFPTNLSVILLFLSGWICWKVGRSAQLGWARLQRLHRLIEEERWEILHHRDTEREELAIMYAAKGFEGKLLEQVLDVLMADDDRLLSVMLEEELGLSLESQEHPLKQALGAGIGVFISSIFLGLSFWLFPLATPFISLIIICLIGAFTASLEKNRKLSAVIWSLSVALFSGGVTYFLSQMV